MVSSIQKWVCWVFCRFWQKKFSISIAQAGLLVSLFALAVAAAGPVMPLLFAGIDRKRVMLLVLSVFVLGNLISVFTDNFAVMLLARVVPAIFHPVYCSLAFSVAAASVSPEAAPRAVAKVIVGVPGWYWEYRSAALLPAVFR